jgi:hypothetical protein
MDTNERKMKLSFASFVVETAQCFGSGYAELGFKTRAISMLISQ